VEELAGFVKAVRDGDEPMLSFEESVACTRATFAIATSLVSNQVEKCGITQSNEASV
jgi:hypothetical protein